MDEVADLNKRVDVRMEEVEEDVGMLKGEVVELRELREAHGWLSRQVGELNTLSEDMHRYLHLPRTPEERAALRIEAGVRNVIKILLFFAQLLLSSLTYVLLSYFVCFHCTNIHTPLPFLSYLYDFQTMKTRHQIHWAKEDL